MPAEFLKKLPGIDSNNIFEVTKKVKNVVELCKMKEDDLKKIIGPRNARELKVFLDKKVEIGKGSNDRDDDF
jgi:ERCC4-type nuclease